VVAVGSAFTVAMMASVAAAPVAVVVTAEAQLAEEMEPVPMVEVPLAIVVVHVAQLRAGVAPPELTMGLVPVTAVTVLDDVEQVGHEITGATPPELTIGDMAVTPVTVPPPLGGGVICGWLTAASSNAHKTSPAVFMRQLYPLRLFRASHPRPTPASAPYAGAVRHPGS
jgi:hypothetical protein